MDELNKHVHEEHQLFGGMYLPAALLEINELSPLDLILFGWVDIFYSKEHEGYFASNTYFAKKLHVTRTTIARSLTKMKNLGLIEQASFDGRKRIIRVIKNLFDRQGEE